MELEAVDSYSWKKPPSTAVKCNGKNLGKGKFLFNFTTEEDLMSVLQKGSFHYNYCMFVLVRWEPVVHDDYPWIIPFWVQLYGFPLHLWTVTNLKNIGSRIGHVDVDSIELTEGRMRIEVDSRRPLKFKRKVESPDAEEVTIDIKYDMLFKHCTTCGLMSHEKGYCPAMEPPARVSSERGGVFTRVQIPQVRNTRQPSLNEYNQLSLQRDTEPARNGAENREMASRWSAPRNQTMVRGRYQDDHAYQNRNTGAGDRFRSHSDRIIRRRDERHSGNRYGGSRYQRGPYDRKEELTWREKKMDMPLLKDKNTAYAQGGSSPKVDDVPYEQLHSNQQGRVRTERSQDEMEVEATGGKMRLASTIVTPSHQLTPQEDNVTIRGKNVALSLTFSPQANGGAGNDQIIGALKDM
ncbi:BnaC04g26050D [Brassica napus]|uniref:BnaC04g26050D protein n=1 Tax=Brassica napus TaxID=3708 RepID=A0A078FFQ2_BRANA|nr:BnaC04g26050D [Brassica napus]